MVHCAGRYGSSILKGKKILVLCLKAISDSLCDKLQLLGTAYKSPPGAHILKPTFFLLKHTQGFSASSGRLECTRSLLSAWSSRLCLVISSGKRSMTFWRPVGFGVALAWYPPGSLALSLTAFDVICLNYSIKFMKHWECLASPEPMSFFWDSWWSARGWAWSVSQNVLNSNEMRGNKPWSIAFELSGKFVFGRGLWKLSWTWVNASISCLYGILKFCRGFWKERFLCG